MPAHEGFFTGAIPGRFNSWNRLADNAFHGHCESERGAYDNELFRGKDPNVSYKEARNRIKTKSSFFPKKGGGPTTNA